MKARRRRAALLVAVALVCGGLAASRVGGREREIEARIGPAEPVVVARTDIAAGTQITPERAARALAVREVPRRYLPRDVLADPSQAAGLTPAAPIAAGGYVTASALGDGPGQAPGAGSGPALAGGQRAIELAVTGAGGIEPGSGTRVDVLVTTERGGGGRTRVALENVELLDLRTGSDRARGGGDGARASADAVATLRVGPRQAVYLAAAQNFAREIRLLARPPGDRRRIGAAAIDGREL